MLKVEEIDNFLTLDMSNREKRQAKVGQRYYEGQHDILQYKLFIPDADGHYVEDKTRSNIKIPHPFFTELVDQEVQYMLSGEEPHVKSDNPELQQLLDTYFDDDFYASVFGFIICQRCNICDAVIAVDFLAVFFRKMRQLQKSFRYFYAFNDLLQNKPEQFFLFGSGDVFVFQQSFQDDANGAQMVFHFMCNRCGHEAQRGYFLLVRKLDVVAQVTQDFNDKGLFTDF